MVLTRVHLQEVCYPFTAMDSDNVNVPPDAVLNIRQVAAVLRMTECNPTC
jgi:hypothetical protein